MSSEKSIRYRFTVPVADETVIDWANAQANLGFSLRVLIKTFVRDHGMADATCTELGTNVKKKGRQSKQSKALLGGILDGTVAGESDVDDDESSVPRSNAKVNTGSTKSSVAKNPTSNSQKTSVDNSGESSIDDINDILGIEPVSTKNPASNSHKVSANNNSRDKDAIDDINDILGIKPDTITNSKQDAESDVKSKFDGKSGKNSSDTSSNDDSDFVDPMDLLNV